MRFKMMLAGILTFALALVTACHRTPGDEAVRHAVHAAQAAAGQADASAFSALLADDFTGNGAERDRRNLVNLLRIAHFRHQTLHVLLGPVSVEARGDRYVARFTATLTSGGGMLPSDLGVYDVETAWRREGGAWRCYAASWKHAL